MCMVILLCKILNEKKILCFKAVMVFSNKFCSKGLYVAIPSNSKNRVMLFWGF